MSKELEALNDLFDLVTCQGSFEKAQRCFDIVEEALDRLEAIDNSEPSEALECLEALEQDIKDRVILAEDRQLKLCAVIKQALLKSQEPKQYIKWEDLEFEHTPKIIDVKMGDNKYKLFVGYNVAGNHLVILRNGKQQNSLVCLSNEKQQYYFLEADKQFFNDLRLERCGRMKDLFGEETIPPEEYFTKEQKKIWYDKFVDYANKEYQEKGDMNGRFCCGYDWCCDRCLMEKMEACEDCVDTILDILKENNVLIDYLDFDFEKWEKIAKEMSECQKKMN